MINPTQLPGMLGSAMPQAQESPGANFQMPMSEAPNAAGPMVPNVPPVPTTPPPGPGGMTGLPKRPFDAPQPNFFKVVNNKSHEVVAHGMTDLATAVKKADALNEKNPVHTAERMHPIKDSWFHGWTPEQRAKAQQIERQRVPGIPGASWRN